MSSKKYDPKKDLSEELSAPLDLADKLGHGFPGVDQSSWSEDDEKRFDEKGRVMVEGRLWSKASTGIYLALYGSFQPIIVDRNGSGNSIVLNSLSGSEVYFGTFVTHGKPRMGVPGFGACLELPEDLGRDGSKQEYLTAWVVETTKEILGSTGGRLKSTDEFGIWLLASCNEAIDKMGL